VPSKVRKRGHDLPRKKGEGRAKGVKKLSQEPRSEDSSSQKKNAKKREKRKEGKFEKRYPEGQHIEAGSVA